MLTRMKPSPIASSLATAARRPGTQGGGPPGLRALTFQQTSRSVRTRTGPAITSTASVGSRLTAGQVDAGSPPSLSVITASSPDAQRPGLVPEASCPRSSVTGTAMTSIGTSGEHEEPAGACEDPPLRLKRHPRAVLEQLECQEIGVDVVAHSLDRVLIRRVLEHGEQQHARDRGDDRGGKPPRHDSRPSPSRNRPRKLAAALSQAAA